MNRFGIRGTVVRSSICLFFLAGLAALAEGQHERKSTPAPAPRSAPAPAARMTAPAQRPPVNRTQPPMNRGPVTNTRPSYPTGNRPNTANMGGRGNMGTTGGRPNTGTMGRTGPAMGNSGRPGTPNRSYRPGAMGNNAHGPMGNGNANARMMNRPGAVNRPLPGRQLSLRGGGSAVIRPNGQIRTINRNGMQINHGINGSRTIISTHNGARVVTTGRNSGYVQRAYVTRSGRTYVSRTVVVNRVTYTSVYRSYSYRGYCCYYAYHPAYYYAPVYYGWAYNP